MAEKMPQTLENHGKFILLYHGVAFGLGVFYFVWSLIGLFRGPSVGTAASAGLGFAFLIVFLFARLFATGNQDRLIRLEERMRMHALLPEDLRGRIDDFTTGQLVALRFASDGELPDLARKVMDEGIDDRKAIKQLIQHWRPDYQRI